MILSARLRDPGMYYNLSLYKQVVTLLSAGELKEKLSKAAAEKVFSEGQEAQQHLNV
jgi:hypothetical protein